ncbi:MAG: mechanosensitive ion channel protein MscS [Gammaproteobacteria bacterium]|nr:MAG: mechanosensitive ion channel protein MscS [Gammaproteobacteria bacterium]
MFDQSNLDHYMNTFIIPWSTNIIFAGLIWFIGRRIVKAIINIISRLFEKTKVEHVLSEFLKSIISALLIAFLAIATLEQLGIPTTSLVAIFGAAGLAIGLSMQDSLKNFAAGVLLIVNRPFMAGDFIEAAGVSGVVENIAIFSTIIRTGDNREIIVPNSNIYGDVIINYSARDTRRIDLVIGIGYEDNIKLAKQTLTSILEADDRILKDPAFAIALGELADCSVNFNVRPWVKSADYWAVRSSLLEEIKITFDAKGISIPYPQQDIHIKEFKQAS